MKIRKTHLLWFFVITLVLVGCVKGAPVATRFNVSGVVQEQGGAPLAGVELLVLRKGNVENTLTTGANGVWQFVALHKDDRIQPKAQQGFTFAPTEHTVSGDRTNVIFTRSPVAETYTVAGVVQDPQGAPVLGVELFVLRNGNEVGSIVTGANGAWQFADLQKDDRIQPRAQQGFTFAPTDHTVSASTTHVIFTRSPIAVTYTVAGVVQDPQGAPVLGVELFVLRNGNEVGSIVTGANGAWQFADLQKDDRIQPRAQQGFTFAPTDHTVSANRSDLVFTRSEVSPMAEAKTMVHDMVRMLEMPEAAQRHAELLQERMETLAPDTERIMLALQVVSFNSESLLSGILFQLEPGFRYHVIFFDGEPEFVNVGSVIPEEGFAIWELELEDGTELRYKTDELDLLEQLVEQFGQMQDEDFDALALEPKGSINFFFETTGEGIEPFHLEGILGVGIPVRDGQVDIVELTDLWLDVVYKDSTETITFSGHVEMRGSVAQSDWPEISYLKYSGSFRSNQFSSEGTLEVDGFEVHPFIGLYPENITFQGRLAISQILQVEAELAVTMYVKDVGHDYYFLEAKRVDIRNLRYAPIFDTAEILVREFSYSVPALDELDIVGDVRIQMNASTLDVAFEGSVKTEYSSIQTTKTVTMDSWTLIHDGSIFIGEELRFVMKEIHDGWVYEEYLEEGVIRLRNAQGLVFRLELQGDIDELIVTGTITAADNTVLAQLEVDFEEEKLIVRYADGTVEEFPFSFDLMVLSQF